MLYFDTHAHLDVEHFTTDLDAVVARAEQAELAGIVCPALDAHSSERVVALAERFPILHAAIGVQPNSCARMQDGDWERIEALIEHPSVVALGETGLDRYWDDAPIELQREHFARHLHLSREHNLPIIIHCRDAEADLMPMLQRAAESGPLLGLIHSFSGDQTMAGRCLELGLHLSFAGQVTYTNRKFQALRDVATTVPLDRLLLETDSPYLVPHPLRGKVKRNEPAKVVHVIRCLAELRGEPIEQIAEQTTTNAKQLFGLIV